MKTEEELEAMKKEVAETENELVIAEKQANCDHEWGEPERIYVEPKAVGYHIPKVQVYKWKRVCNKCKKEETTKDYKEKITRIPQFKND